MKSSWEEGVPVGALDSFMSTWSSARDTFGQGTPQDGTSIDRSSDLRQAQSGVNAAAPGSRWTGSAADAYGAANTKQGQTLGQMAVLDQRLGAEVDRSAAVITAGRQNLDSVKQWVNDAAASVPQGADREQMLTQIARKGLGDVSDVIRQTNGDLNRIGARIQQIGNEYRIIGGPKLNGPGDKDPGKPGDWVPPYDTGSDIPVGKSPEEIKKWWDALPQRRRDELVERWPEKVGNLNGIPVADRSRANKIVMQRDLDRPAEVARARGVTVDEVFAHPEKYGMAGQMMDRYNNACEVQKALDADATNARDANNKTPDILLMKYDPEAFGGKGSAAIAIGNPDSAANTTVMVSGLTTSVAAGTLADGSGVNVYNEANLADRNNSTAVVQWMGYDAPNGPSVVEPFKARDGAQILAPDVNALAVTHEGSPSHTTVIGHSYGSTTVADAAARYGMHADDIVLVGCPGTDLAKSAADFNLPPGGHLYVGSASTDLVTNLGREHINVPGVGLGTDPAMNGYGSTRFHAEVATLSPNPIHEHTEYFRDGSESLFSIADIVSGHGDALEHDGMTAPHRVTTPRPPFPVPGLPQLPVIDPELGHRSNNDHHHT